ncbi:hypothetical protein LCGC14_1099850 [marine sediment metagenome]|uniref:Uncharacterized protein n=1 Tax=marine sediment metagenome TaxID=412755 RepID=A0A0F9MEC4_9ZZZZ
MRNIIILLAILVASCTFYYPSPGNYQQSVEECKESCEAQYELCILLMLNMAERCMLEWTGCLDGCTR